MINFLYCFDKNYRIQGNNSIFSLLENVTEKINIFIIHSDSEDTGFLDTKILQHKNLNNIFLKKFKGTHNYPNLEEAHVSSATYFRLFLSDYIDNTINSLIYLDADFICVNDPVPVLKNKINLLSKSDSIIACTTEFGLDSPENLNRFGLDPVKYFNAGFMIIDYQKWNKFNTSANLIDKLNQNSFNLKYWDQDLLNIHFYGDFLELEKNLNYQFQYNLSKKTESSYETKEEIFFIHYSGKFKPWSVRGALEKNSDPYHDTYRRINGKKYHIYNNWKMNTFKQLLTIVFNGEILSARYPRSLFYYSVISLFLRKSEKL